MEQLISYNELIKAFEYEIINELNKNGNAANVINKFIPIILKVERKLKHAILENRMSIRCKSDLNQLIMLHQLFQKLLNDLLVTSPVIANHRVIEKLCYKTNNLELTLKISTCITNLLL